MTSRPALLALVAPLLALSLVACGGGSDTDSADPVTSEATTSPAPPATPSASAAESDSPSASPSAVTSASPSAATSAPAGADATGAGDPGVAPKGAVIVGGGFTALPETVGAFTKRPGKPDPAILYEMGSALNSVSLLSGSDYDSISTNVAEKVTPGGTGVCGTSAGGYSKICYLKAADGVYTLTGDDNLTVPDLVVFANQLTAALGTS